MKLANTRYEITLDGHVYYMRGSVKHELRQALNDDGYLTVRLTIDGRRVRTPVHSLILLANAGPRPSSLHCTRHLDGNRLNNNVLNLAWGTPKENSEDRHRHGTTPRGVTHPGAKLTDDRIRAIRAAYHNGMRQVDIAVEHGVTKHTIWGIVHRRTWRHLSDATVNAAARKAAA